MQQYEDVELPSLPSISHDVNCDQTTEYPEADSSVLSGNEVRAIRVHATVDWKEWSTPQVGRPFPTPSGDEPLSSRRCHSLTYKSSLLSANDSFSDFHSSPRHQLSDEDPSFLADLSKSQHIPSKSTVPTENRSDFWEDSMDSKRLPAADAEAGATSDTENTSLHDTFVETSIASVMDTPLPRHYQQNNVSSGRPTVTTTESRIPSLTRSEVSGTDQEATTPESHGRSIQLTARSSSALSIATAEPSERDQAHQLEASNMKSTPASSRTVTPAVIRYMDTPSTAARAAATPFGLGAALRDMTRRHTNMNHDAVPSTPFTPSVDYNKTPRAALDDAERRRNHVLSVLASSALPSRTKRSTPHPRRHVPVGGKAESISEALSFQASLVDFNGSMNMNESFISVASSQDLTPDRRGSRAVGQRANTSVPNILYSGTMASPGVSHLDNRPDTVKIQKHLNMMNQQLLDNNADLAREAEEWRSECTRLIGIMREAGIPIDDDGNVLGELPKLSGDDSLDLPIISEQRSLDNSFAHAAMARRIEELEVQLRDKDGLNLRMIDSPKEAPCTNDDTELVASLEQQLQVARKAHEDLKSEFAQKTKDHTAQFAEICTEYEEQVRQLQGQLRQREEELAGFREASKPPSEERTVKEEELQTLRNRVQQQERSLAETAIDLSNVRDQLEQYIHEVQQHKERTSELEDRLQASITDNELAKRDVADLESAFAAATAEKAAALEESEQLRDRLHDLDRQLSTQRSIMEDQRETLKNLEDLAAHEHTDLEEAQRNLKEARKDLSQVQQQLSQKDQEIEIIRGQAEITMLGKRAAIDDTHEMAAEPSIILALEERLEAAHREIGRLKHDAQMTPVRQSALESRDARISALETEKLTLMERLKAQEVSSPARWSNSMMTSTPLHKTVTSLRLPRTPGTLKDVGKIDIGLQLTTDFLASEHYWRLE